MHTLSGRRFDLGGDWNITVRDVAVGLSRIPRWAGATLVPWTVLQHSLAVYRRATYLGAPIEARLYALWHDAEEMATGDIPAPFKTREQKVLQEQLLRWVYEKALHRPFPPDSVCEFVKALDDEARVVEVHTLCHPRVRFDFPDVSPDLDACDVFWELFDLPVQDAITEFVQATDRLLGLEKHREQLAEQLKYKGTQ